MADSPETLTPVSQLGRAAARGVGRAVRGTLGLQGQRMSKVDTAWLRMDSPSNLMMIVSVWVLKPRVDYAAVCQRVQDRLLRYPRFGQRVMQDAAGATWVTDARFDVHHHVRCEKLTPSSGKRARTALQRRVAQLAMQPLDPRRPLWQFHLIEDYDGGSALIARIHHCIADGIALIAVMQSMVDGGTLPPQRKRALPVKQDPESWLTETVLKPLTETAVRALDLTGTGAASALNWVGQPTKGLEFGLGQSLDAARLAMQVARDAAALVLMPDDSRTSLKGDPGRSKRVAWCEPLPLAEVKAVSKALRCSVNDVLLSCVAGAISAYLQARGENVRGQEIRAMVPVNLRPMERAHELGNRFGLAPVVLPLGLDNPVQRVMEVRRRMRELKGSLQPLLAFSLLAVAGLLIKPAQDALLGLFARKTTAVMTNVPGPREKLTLCGSTLEQSLFWVPQSGTVGMGVSILSYGGAVQFGLITDAKLCPHPEHIIAQFEPEFDKLAWLTLMLPWEES